MTLQHIVLFSFPRELTEDEAAEMRGMVASWPTEVSRSRQSGPIRAPGPMSVRPSRWVPGRISASGASVTSTSIQVDDGSTIVAPARIQASSRRPLQARCTSAPSQSIRVS